MHKDRIKIAVALGYYARAAGEIQTLADAIAAYALDEYRNDVDCQVGFRKGYQEAEKHLAKNGPEAHELRELVGWIARLEQRVHEQRADILEYLKRQEALAAIPSSWTAVRAAAARIVRSPSIPMDAASPGDWDKASLEIEQEAAKISTDTRIENATEAMERAVRTLGGEPIDASPRYNINLNQRQR